MAQFELSQSVEQTKEAIVSIFQEKFASRGIEVDPREERLAMQIVDILYGTELPPKFEIRGITSTDNDSVESKAEYLLRLQHIGAYIVPDSLIREYPISYDKAVIEKAPWVNMIHAWTKVISYMNTISAMQRGESKLDTETIVAITHELWKFTTDANDEFLLRSDSHFHSFEKYPETRMRESGTPGVNTKRHVCPAELKYILDIIHQVMHKSE